MFFMWQMASLVNDPCWLARAFISRQEVLECFRHQPISICVSFGWSHQKQNMWAPPNFLHKNSKHLRRVDILSMQLVETLLRSKTRSQPTKSISLAFIWRLFGSRLYIRHTWEIFLFSIHNVAPITSVFFFVITILFSIQQSDIGHWLKNWIRQNIEEIKCFSPSVTARPSSVSYKNIKIYTWKRVLKTYL